MLERIFQLSENESTVRRELLAGLTTFLTMAYIVFVQPRVMSTDFNGAPTGLDPGAVLLATCLSSALATLLMGLWARYPIALAPGMGENFFFVTVVMTVAAQGVSNPWQTALGIVFVSGVLFLLLSILDVQGMILDAMSPSMRHAIAVGIGLFIALLGLKSGANYHGLIATDSVTFGKLNVDHFVSADLAVFWLGLLVMVVLHIRRVPGAIVIGIVAGSLLAAALGKIQWPDSLVGVPEVEQSAIFKMDIRAALTWTCLPFVFIFLYMDLFDTMGTLIGVSEQAGFVKNNQLPRTRQAFTSDAIGTVVGAALGTSTVTSYIESIAGVAQGGRTGLTAVTVAVLFLVALLVSPLIGMIGMYPPITMPALVLVGVMMAQGVKKIAWDDASEAVPAFLTILGIPLCFSIADGMALGMITYPIVKGLSGRLPEVKWLMYVLAAILLLYFILVRVPWGSEGASE
jgi:AGZA family xanthine/uracil permease-like MFS transporter